MITRGLSCWIWPFCVCGEGGGGGGGSDDPPDPPLAMGLMSVSFVSDLVICM